MHACMDNICLLSNYLDRHVLEINGNFIPKSEPFIIGNYWVPIINLKYDAKNYAFMMDSSHELFYSMSINNKDSGRMLINPTKMVSQKKLLALKFEYLHFEPLINSLFAPFCELEFLECNSYNILDDDEDGKKICSAQNMDKTL